MSFSMTATTVTVSLGGWAMPSIRLVRNQAGHGDEFCTPIKSFGKGAHVRESLTVRPSATWLLRNALHGYGCAPQMETYMKDVLEEAIEVHRRG